MTSLWAMQRELAAAPRKPGDACLRVSPWLENRPGPPRCKTKCGSVVAAFRGRTVAEYWRASCPRCQARMLGEYLAGREEA